VGVDVPVDVDIDPSIEAALFATETSCEADHGHGNPIEVQ
jgi:hypothetical protein